MDGINTTVLIKKLGKFTKAPLRATFGSAGLDIFAAIDEGVLLSKNTTVKIPSGIAIELPSSNYVAFLLARSGLSINHGIILANSVGVIDSDYRGEIIVGLRNCTDRDYIIKPGDKIAQLLFFKTESVRLELVDNLSDTHRGGGGLGSTGR